MTAATDRLQVSIDPSLKERVNRKLDMLGLTPSALINALYKQVDAQNRVPFELSLTPRQQATARIAEAVSGRKPDHDFQTGKDFAAWYDQEYGEY